MAAPTGMDNPKVKMAGTNPSAAPTAEPAARPVAPPVAPKAAAPPATPAQVAWTWPSWHFFFQTMVEKWWEATQIWSRKFTLEFKMMIVIR